MPGTVTINRHEDVRDWASARAGFPAIVDVSPDSGVQPMLRLVFDEQAYQDRAERPANAGGYELVEWDEWFRLFDKLKLALVVAADGPGPRDNSYEIIRLPD